MGGVNCLPLQRNIKKYRQLTAAKDFNIKVKPCRKVLIVIPYSFENIFILNKLSWLGFNLTIIIVRTPITKNTKGIDISLKNNLFSIPPK